MGKAIRSALALKLHFGPELGLQMDPKLAQKWYMKGPRWLPQRQEVLLETKIDKHVPKMGQDALPDPPIDQNMRPIWAQNEGSKPHTASNIGSEGAPDQQQNAKLARQQIVQKTLAHWSQALLQRSKPQHHHLGATP